MRPSVPPHDHLAPRNTALHQPVHQGAVVPDLLVGVLVEGQVLDRAGPCLDDFRDPFRAQAVDGHMNPQLCRLVDDQAEGLAIELE